MSKSLIASIIIFSIILLFGSYFLFSGGNQTTPNIKSYSKQDKEKPKIEIKETSADMGKIKVSEIKERVFAIKNIGSKPLSLFNISSSCNCTTGQIVYQGKTSPEYGMHAQGDFDKEIMPGEEVKVKVIYRPFVMPVYGLVEREVYISTNDPNNQKLVFKVKAFVE